MHQLTQGYSHYDRQLRNDLLVVSSLISSTNTATAALVESGYCKQLALFGTFQEGEWVRFWVRILNVSAEVRANFEKLRNFEKLSKFVNFWEIWQSSYAGNSFTNLQFGANLWDSINSSLCSSEKPQRAGPPPETLK